MLSPSYPLNMYGVLRYHCIQIILEDNARVKEEEQKKREGLEAQASVVMDDVTLKIKEQEEEVRVHHTDALRQSAYLIKLSVYTFLAGGQR